MISQIFKKKSSTQNLGYIHKFAMPFFQNEVKHFLRKNEPFGAHTNLLKNTNWNGALRSHSETESFF